MIALALASSFFSNSSWGCSPAPQSFASCSGASAGATPPPKAKRTLTLGDFVGEVAVRENERLLKEASEELAAKGSGRGASKGGGKGGRGLGLPPRTPPRG